MPPGGLEGGLPLIPLSDAHKVVCAPEVQLCEDGRPYEGFKVGTHEGERILVFDGNVIQQPVVYACPQVLHKEEPRCHRGLRWSNETLSQAFLQVAVHRRLLRQREVIQTTGREGSVRTELDGTVVGPVWRERSWYSGAIVDRSGGTGLETLTLVDIWAPRGIGRGRWCSN